MCPAGSRRRKRRRGLKRRRAWLLKKRDADALKRERKLLKVGVETKAI